MSKFWAIFGLSVLGLMGCSSGTVPQGTLRVWMASPTVVQFESVLALGSSFAMNGIVGLPPYGDVYFNPAQGNQGFTFGGRLDLKAFQLQGWAFPEVSALPTGFLFPPWIQGPLVQVPLPNDYFAYLGVRDQKVVGVAWSFIKTTGYPIGIGANYYDHQGRIVMGGVFYPPVLFNNSVMIPGGLFVGTNLSPLFPSTPRASQRFAEQPLAGGWDQSEKSWAGTSGEELTPEYFAFDLQTREVRGIQVDDLEVLDRYLKALKKAGQRLSPQK